ncbi:MAG: hypothetical protein WC565_04445 [Parcubacteria group bacterium]|jgi:hypothetical protein
MTRKEALLVLKYIWGLRGFMTPQMERDINDQRQGKETLLECVKRLAGIEEQVNTARPSQVVRLVDSKLEELRTQ